jgi:hypothetical protein
MKRLLLAAALGAGLLTTVSPANACEFRQCAWGQIVCSTVTCPRYCETVAGRRLCVIN